MNNEYFPEAIILIGIPASGKSEFYRQNFSDTHVRINLDMLKTRTRERILFDACIMAKQSLVVDNTNPMRSDRARYLAKAKDAGFCAVGYYFRSSVADSIQRNNSREGKAHIPATAIAAIMNKMEFPSIHEGFDKLYYVSIGKNDEFIVEDYSDEV